jgi:hypothetical protein
VAAGPVGEAVRAVAEGDAARLAAALAQLKPRSWRDAALTLIDMLATGAAMMLDDARDVGRLDRLHHWQIGALLAVAATLFLPVLILSYEGDQHGGG